MNSSVKKFFSHCETLDYYVLRPLSHLTLNWELTWDSFLGKYYEEEYSFAYLLNNLINELAETMPPANYHINEDLLAENVAKELNWKIQKNNNRWIGASYDSILEQGGFSDFKFANLVRSAAGRIKTAIERDQRNFDQMEESHKKMLASILTTIIYHRADLSGMDI